MTPEPLFAFPKVDAFEVSGEKGLLDLLQQFEI